VCRDILYMIYTKDRKMHPTASSVGNQGVVSVCVGRCSVNDKWNMLTCVLRTSDGSHCSGARNVARCASAAGATLAAAAGGGSGGRYASIGLYAGLFLTYRSPLFLHTHTHTHTHARAHTHTHTHLLTHISGVAAAARSDSSTTT
jgi:hypothetical protein